MNPAKPEPLLFFGSFSLDLQRRGLYRGQERVRLTAKPLETLIYLVENCGRVVTKQEILDSVWKGTFVTEDTLVHAIREIRRALGDDRDNPKYVLTIPREGYRFVCEVGTQHATEAVDLDRDIDTPSAPKALLAVPTAREPSTIRPPEANSSAPHRKRWLVPVAAIVLFSTFLVARQISGPLPRPFAGWLTRGAPTASAPKAFRIGTESRLTTKTVSEGKPALSADGKLLLYISTNPDDNERAEDGEIRTFGDLFVKEMATGESTQITHRENPSGDIPVFTADGNFVVFSNYPKDERGSSTLNLYKVGSNGGRVDKSGNPIPFDANPVPFIKEASGAGFSPDGQWVAYTKRVASRRVLWLSPAEDPEASHKEIASYGFTPRWSADGKWLAYTTSDPNGGLGDIWVVDATTFSNPRNVTNEQQQIYGLTWTPDGRNLIFCSKRAGRALLWRVPFEGAPAESVNGSDGDFSTPSMSSQSNMLVYVRYYGAQNIFVSEGLDAEARNLTKTEYHQHIRLSPSGQLLASIMQKPDSGQHVYITDFSGNQTCLSQHVSHNPSWINEKKLIYLHWDDATQQTEPIEVDVTDLKKPVSKPLRPFAGRADWLDVNPVDETKLVVVLTTGEKQRILLRNLATDQDVIIASGLEYAHLRWSGDGTTVAWSAPSESGKESAGVWTIKPLIETAPRRVVTDGFNPVWSADNSVIYFARVGSQAGLFEFDLKTKREKKRRNWKQTAYFDVVRDRLVYCELGSNVQTQVYSRTVE